MIRPHHGRQAEPHGNEATAPPSTRSASASARERLLALLLATVLPAAVPPATFAQTSAPTVPPEASFLGFDRNDYPGDAALPALRRQFSFVGFWLNPPPGETADSWLGRRETLRRAGFGFVVLWNGRLDRALLHAGVAPERLGGQDAAAAVAAATREGFPARTVLFLDQEEGGRLLPEQAAYLLAWTEAVAAAGLVPGVYASGQPVTDGPGQTITTAQDITARVRAGHLHPVALWVAQDACPPAPGCVFRAPSPSASGTPDALVWQFAQSPRRPAITRACARTYAADGACAPAGMPALFLDLNTAGSPDPSLGR